MAQPSILHYFNCKKRAAPDDCKLDKPSKLLKLNEERPKLAHRRKLFTDSTSNKELVTQLTKKIKQADAVLKDAAVLNPEISRVTQINPILVKDTVSPETSSAILPNENVTENKEENTVLKDATVLNLGINHATLDNPVASKNTSCNEGGLALLPNSDVVESKKDVKELNHISNKLQKSKKYAELKKMLDQFQKSPQKLETVGKRSEKILESLKAGTVHLTELRVPVSPQKTRSPVKSLPSDPKPSLQLPFKYRTLNEIFRAIDTIVQIKYNRQEIITFTALKPAVEELMKRNFQKTHLAQIKFIYPSAFDFTQKRIKTFSARQDEWDLVITPTIKTPTMTTVDLLDRRRKFHCLLIDRVKNYHSEFLSSLTPPISISKDDVTSWHSEFPVDKAPDIEYADLPETPTVQIHTSGKQVLETARRLFSTNVRMNPLPNLETTSVKQPAKMVKGIPEGLLEKVRQKQASKALMAMTRNVEKEKKLQVYARLPEIARFVRNLFVTEKKSVLQLDVVIEKLGNSYRTFLNKNDMEHHLKVLSAEVPGWLVFHNVRNCVFIKLDKNGDLNAVLSKLEKLIKQMKET